MAKIGIGIIGTGSIVKVYAKCIAELKESKLVALYTKSSKRIAEVEKLFGVKVYDDIDAFMANPDIQLICVCNESGKHGEAIKKSAEAGKHVLCEKPLELTPEKIDEAIAICNQYKVILGCVFQNRCSADYKIVEKMVKTGALGKLLMGNAHINWYRSPEYYSRNPWRGTLRFDGGAALINQGIHTIDLLVNLMGPVRSVFGNVKTMVHQIQGEDVATALLNFDNGSVGVITGGTALFPGYPERLEIFGEKGSIIMEAGKIKEWNVQGKPAPESKKGDIGLSGAADPTNIDTENHKAVLLNMIKAIKENGSPMVDGAEARKSVEVITGIYRSSKEEKLIYF
ncbi:MAG: Gfo/Idh/MocA family oxidoreductase [Flavobacteriaceae bacterium]